MHGGSWSHDTKSLHTPVLDQPNQVTFVHLRAFGWKCFPEAEGCCYHKKKTRTWRCLSHKEANHVSRRKECTKVQLINGHLANNPNLTCKGQTHEHVWLTQHHTQEKQITQACENRESHQSWLTTDWTQILRQLPMKWLNYHHLTRGNLKFLNPIHHQPIDAMQHKRMNLQAHVVNLWQHMKMLVTLT